MPAIVLAAAATAGVWACAGAAPASSPSPRPAAAGWRYCSGSFTVLSHGKRWRLSRFRTSGVGCTRAKAVGRRCNTTGCPTGWKHRVDYVAGRPPVWWHSAWTYTISPFAHVQWRAVRA